MPIKFRVSLLPRAMRFRSLGLGVRSETNATLSSAVSRSLLTFARPCDAMKATAWKCRASGVAVFPHKSRKGHTYGPLPRKNMARCASRDSRSPRITPPLRSWRLRGQEPGWGRERERVRERASLTGWPGLTMWAWMDWGRGGEEGFPQATHPSPSSPVPDSYPRRTGRPFPYN